jgi:hypothetical protein
MRSGVAQDPSPLFEDTAPSVERVLVEGYRRMSAAQKLQRVLDMNRTVEILALARIRAERPSADEHEIKLRLASLRLDRDTMIRVFRWDPEEMGY